MNRESWHGLVDDNVVLRSDTAGDTGDSNPDNPKICGALTGGCIDLSAEGYQVLPCTVTPQHSTLRIAMAWTLRRAILEAFPVHSF